MKRRPITLLPVIHQTTALTRFFGSTVDQLFQPGASEPVSGYIGRTPPYNNPSTDFYKQEITPERQKYQLETAMVSSTNGSVNTMLFYDDLLARLSKLGANTSSAARLFATNYYSWAPPIDIDKITFFQNYYWSDGQVAELFLTSPGCELGEYSNGDGTTTSFKLPPVLAGSPAESPAVVIDGAAVSTFTRSGGGSGDYVVMSTPPADGSTVVVYRYGNVASGTRSSFTIGKAVAGYAAQGVFVYANTDPVDPSTFTVVGENVIFSTPPASGMHITATRYRSLKKALEGRVQANVSAFNTKGVTDLINGMRVRLVDPTTMFIGFDIKPYDTFGWDERVDRTFIVDGVGQSILLLPDDGSLLSYQPFYVVVDRRSRDRSFWSRVNRWVRREALAWSGDDTAARRARRPIIEFLPNLTLYNYGSQRQPNVDAAITVAPLVNGQPIAYDSINGRSYKSVFVDGNVQLGVGERVLIAVPNDTSAYNNLIYDVQTVETTPGAFVYLLVPESITDSGDIVQVGTSTVEYYYTGTQWVLAATQTDQPLFQLYDSDGVALDDAGVYPTSNFHGSKIFGYELSTGHVDPVLDIPVKHDSYGQIIFENYLYTQRFAYRDGDIIGYYYYDRDGAYENEWNLSSTPLAFDADNAAVPLNLQANPDFDDVKYISRNGFFEQFTSIMKNQVGFTGQPYTANNWSQTARDLTKGTAILQHEAPLLRLMLLLSKDEYSLKSAIQFTEQEFVRFKLKYLHKIKTWLKDGTIVQGDDITTVANRVLDNLKLSKTPEFAFSTSTIGGRNDFIPPTPSCFGIRPLVLPAYFTDTNGTTFVRGHDGSLVQSIDPYVDSLLLAFETRIYQSVSGVINEIAPIDLTALVQGKYRTGEYTRADYLNISASMFDSWTRRNKVNYRVNSTFEYGNPWTYNYSSSADRYGNAVPGNWRGIYLWYFDTITPHLTPWEMLGFSEEPTWWAAQYGEAPYTRDNSAMWTDLENGIIRQGPRAGRNLNYARPNLMQVLPVDANANLLDPIEATIIESEPALQFARRDWTYGDLGDVEYAWRRSSSFGFAQTLATFLMKPAKFVESYWDGNRELVHDTQWVDKRFLLRQHCADMVVHRSYYADGTQKEARGIENWIVEHIASSGKSQIGFELDLRGVQPRLAHKMGGFTSADRMTVIADHFGLVPAEDVAIALHATPSIRDYFYSGVLIERTNYGWRVIGYNPDDPFFDVMLPDRSGRKVTLFGGANRVINQWTSGVYYKVGQFVAYQGGQYQAEKNHTSGRTFENNYWSLDPSVDPVQQALVRHREYTGETIRVAYGTEFRSRQEIIDFLFGYVETLQNSGFIFGDDGNWDHVVEEFYNWSKVDWKLGAFIAVSPAANELIFSTALGYVLDLESSDSFNGGLYDNAGQPVDAKKAVVDRYDDQTIIRNANIYGARLRVGEVEHVLIFSNTTIFGDVIYDPLLNIRQERMKLSARRTQNWVGRYDAPGFVISGNDIAPNFDKSADDLRYMFDIELADNTILRDQARHLIGFQRRDYLDKLLLSETQQFELYQGMIQAKGTAGSFERLLRSTKIGYLNSDLRFLEEFGFRLDDFGAYKPNAEIELLIRQTDLRREPQLISLKQNTRADWLNIIPSDSRWLSDTPDFADLMVDKVNARLNLPDAGYVRTTEATYSYMTLPDMATDFKAKYAAGSQFVAGMSAWVYNYNLAGFNVLYLLNPVITDLSTHVQWFQNHDTALAMIPAVPLVEDQIVVDSTTVLLPDVCQSDPVVIPPVVPTPPYVAGTNILGQRLVLDHNHNFVLGDVVLLCNSLEARKLGGIHTVTGVGTNWIEIEVADGDSINRLFLESESDIRPQVFKLTTARVANSTALTGLSGLDGKLVFVDDAGSGKWAVVRGLVGVWTNVRTEPKRVNTNKIVSNLLYDNETTLDAKSLRPLPLIASRITPIDPLAGIISGVADREIDFKLDYDPAEYSPDNNDELWSNAEVGKLWWNTSTTFYLNYYTDNVDSLDPTSLRYIEEMEYRSTNWAKIAPGTSIDIYEWVRSTSAPDVNDVTLYDANKYVVQTEWNAKLLKTVTYYYFWQKSTDTAQALNSVELSAMLSSPSRTDLPWMSIIGQYAMVIGGVKEFLGDVSSVFQMKLQLTDEDHRPKHQEWELRGPLNGLSRPDDSLWNKMRDSLRGFDDLGGAIPAPSKHQIGIDRGQSMISPANLLDARNSFIKMLNYILARHDLVADGFDVANITYETPISDTLHWSYNPLTIVRESPPPATEYNVEVSDWDALEAVLADTPTATVLLRQKDQWSVWHNVNATPTLVPTYQHAVETIAERNALVGVLEGEKVYVRSDVSGFWTIYKMVSGVYQLLYAQTYRTEDFWARYDYYAPSVSYNKPPVLTYATFGERNAKEAGNVEGRTVKVLDDGEGRWVWTTYADGVWNIVARELGTIQFNRLAFIRPDKFGVGGVFDLSKIAVRDGSFELGTIIEALRAKKIITALELNELWFSFVHFVHARHDQVDWSFMTSFLSILGLNEPIVASPVALPDPTNALVSYINEVKPYRVTIRDLSKVLATADEMHVGMQETRLMKLKMKLDRMWFEDISPFEARPHDNADIVFDFLRNYYRIDNAEVTNFFDLIGARPLNRGRNDSVAYDDDGTEYVFAANQVRLTNKGMLVEPTSTNLIKSGWDLTGWTATGTGTVLLNQTSMSSTLRPTQTDHPTLCSSMQATANTYRLRQQVMGTVNDWTFSLYGKRVTGNGVVNINIYNSTGTTIIATSQLQLNSTNFIRGSVTVSGVANPWFEIEMSKSGDVIIVDRCQIETMTYASTWIAQGAGAAVPRLADYLQIVLPISYDTQNALTIADSFEPLQADLMGGTVWEWWDEGNQAMGTKLQLLHHRYNKTNSVHPTEILSKTSGQADLLYGDPQYLVTNFEYDTAYSFNILMNRERLVTDGSPLIEHACTVWSTGKRVLTLGSSSGQDSAPMYIRLFRIQTGEVTKTELFNYGRGVYNGGELTSGAAGRILSYYQPTVGMREKNLATLLDLDFKGTVLDGSTLDDIAALDIEVQGSDTASSEISINADANGVDGYRMRDARVGENRPQELIAAGALDVLVFKIHDRWMGGAPEHVVRYYDTRLDTDATRTFETGIVSRDLAVFRDGVRAKPTDYTWDILKAQVTVSLVNPDSSAVSHVAIHSFGFAATTRIIDQKYLVTSGGVDSITIPNTDSARIEVLVDGQPFGGTVNKTGVAYSFTDSVGKEAVITAYTSTAPDIISLDTRTLSYNTQKTWDISGMSEKVPYYTSIIIEVNGLRLTPPRMFYAHGVASIQLEGTEYADITNFKVWYNNTYNDVVAAVGTFTNFAEAITGASGALFVVWNSNLIFNVPNAATLSFTMVTFEDNEYTISIGGQLVITKTLSSGDSIQATTFKHNNTVDMRTWAFRGQADSSYRIETKGNPGSSWLTLNGKRLVEHIDYYIKGVPIGGYDILGWDTFPFDDPFEIDFVLKHPPATPPEDWRLVITTFEGRQNLRPSFWQFSTTAPDIVRLRPSPNGSSRPFLLEERAWATEAFEEVRKNLAISSPVAQNDNHLVLTVNPRNTPSIMYANDPVIIPDKTNNLPGHLWIKNERIEYFDFSRTPTTITLKEVRRGTRGSPRLSHATGTELFGFGKHPYHVVKTPGDIIPGLDGPPTAPPEIDATLVETIDSSTSGSATATPVLVVEYGDADILLNSGMSGSLVLNSYAPVNLQGNLVVGLSAQGTVAVSSPNLKLADSAITTVDSGITVDYEVGHTVDSITLTVDRNITVDSL